MTDACGARFHLFRTGADTDTITDVLLCSGVSLTGPGEIYRLRFQASDTPQVTHIQFLDGLQFYNEGLYVNPAIATDLDIGIGTGLVGVDSSPPGKLDLLVSPNPTIAGGTTFTIRADRAGVAKLSAFDLRGRLVRRFDDMTITAGLRVIHWDGSDSAGHALAPGIYLVNLEMEGRSVTRRVSIVR